MKNMTAVITSIMLIFLLSACGQQQTKEEVVDAAFDKAINSFQVNLKTNVEIQSNGQKLKQSFKFNMKYINKPFTAYLKANMVSGDFKLYLNKQSAYILPPKSETWVKTPTKSVEEFAKIASGEAIKKSFERVKKFADLFGLEQTESGYVLSVKIDKSSSKKEKELVNEVLNDSVKNSKIKIESIDQFDYTLKVDKNYLIKQITSTAKVKGMINGQSSKMTVKADAVYQNVNNIKPFSVPKEVKEKAVKPGQ